MRGLLAIVRKDLWVARWPLSILGAFTLLLALLMLAPGATPDTGPLEGPAFVLVTMCFLVPLALGHVVVARELSGRTQLFLETLPVSRAQIAGAKAVVVIGGSVLVVGGTAALCGLVADVPGLAGIFVARLTMFAVEAGAVAFTFGFLGRYRAPLFLFALFLLVWIATLHGESDLDRFAAFALVDSTLALERTVWPWRAFADAAMVTLAALGAGLVLSLVREGDVAARLAERMSRRERVFVLLAGTFAGFGIVAAKPPPGHPPYELTSGVQLEERGVVLIADANVDRSWLQRIPDHVATTIQLLGSPRVPPLFLLQRDDLPPQRVENGKLGGRDGILLRARLDGTPLLDRRIAASFLHGILVRHSERNLKEDRHALLDGATLLGASCDGPLDDDRERLLVALRAAPAGPSDALVDQWSRTMNALGMDTATSLAFVGLRVLCREVGSGATWSFLREVLGTKVPRDVRALFETPDVEEALQRHTGWTLQRWRSRWREVHREENERLHDALATIPTLHAAARVESLGSAGRKLVASLAPGTELAGASRLEVQYQDVDLGTPLLEEDDAQLEDHPAASLEEGVVIGSTWSEGQRVALRVARRDPRGFEVASPWLVLDLP